MKNLDIEQKKANATKWSMITEIIAKCIAPITNLILARLLAPEAFGVVATVTMIVSFAEIFTDAGFQKYLMQHEFQDEEDLNSSTTVAFWTNLIFSLLIWGIICIFSNQLADLVGNPGLGNVIIISSIAIPLVAFSSIQMARYKRDFNFKQLFFVRIISALVPLFVTVPLAWLLRTYWALIIGSLAGNFVTVIILAIHSKWKPKIYYSFEKLKKMFSYSWWILLESIATWLTSYIDIFIVGRALSLYYVGLYKTAMTTVNQITNLIVAATSGPLFVILSRLQNDKGEMIDVYYKFIKAISVLLIPLGVGIFLYRNTITTILLGAQWTEAENFIGLWGLMSAFSLLLSTYCNGLYNALGKTYLSFWAQVLHLVVLIPFLMWSSERGFECLYITRSLVRLEFVVVQLFIMKFAIRAPILRLIKQLCSASAASLVMCISSVIFSEISTIFLWQIISIFMCMIIYFFALYIIDREALFDCLKMFGIKLKKNIEEKRD